MQLLPWFLGFNPVIEAPKINLVWVKIPGLPLELWTLKSLNSIGNSIVHMKHIYPQILGKNDKHIAWILVEVCFVGGFLGDVDLVWGQRNHRQRVDYWGVPFRCLTCHHIGHLHNKCLLRHKNMGRGGKFFMAVIEEKKLLILMVHAFLVSHFLPRLIVKGLLFLIGYMIIISRHTVMLLLIK